LRLTAMGGNFSVVFILFHNYSGRGHLGPVMVARSA
jgi:hypothetical protein